LVPRLHLELVSIAENKARGVVGFSGDSSLQDNVGSIWLVGGDSVVQNGHSSIRTVVSPIKSDASSSVQLGIKC